jgi:hypothetical protein
VGAKPDTVFAQRPNTLWCWDITHLRTTQPWVFLYLYVLLDWVSRKVIAWHLAETLESREVLTLWDRGLQDEGLLSRVGDDELEVGALLNQAADLGLEAVGRAEVGADAAAQVGRLAHVDDLALAVAHDIDAGAIGKRPYLGLQTLGRCGLHRRLSHLIVSPGPEAAQS